MFGAKITQKNESAKKTSIYFLFLRNSHILEVVTRGIGTLAHSLWPVHLSTKIDNEEHHALSAPIKKWIEFVEEYNARGRSFV